jgi:hypothetical protein
MKSIKFLIIMVLMLICSAINAQFRFGIKGGFAASKIEFKGADFDADQLHSFCFGPSIEWATGRGGIGIDLSALFSKQGFTLDDGVKVSNTYLDIPVNLKFKLGLPLINPFVSAGPYAAFVIGGHKDWSGTANSVIGQGKTKSFGAGLNFAFGAEVLRFLQISFGYNVALTNNYDTFDARHIDSYIGKTRTKYVIAAIYF